MHPHLFSFFGVEITTYGLMVALAFVTLWFCTVFRGKRLGFSPDFIQNLLTLIVIAAMVSARLLYVIVYWPYFAENPGDIIFSREGYVFLGGLVGGVAVALWYTRRHKHSILGVADLFAPYVPLAHGIGRIGCFLYGCCFGAVCSLPWAVEFPKNSPAYYAQLNSGDLASGALHSLPVHPTQIYSVLGNWLIFAILILLQRKQQFRGQLAMGYLMLYSVIRFLIEAYRADPRGAWAGFSTSQWISLLMLAGGAIGYWLLWKRGIEPLKPQTTQETVSAQSSSD